MQGSGEHKTARIVFTRSGRGLLKDAQLLQALMEQEGWVVSLHPLTVSYFSDRFTYYWERAKIRLPGKWRQVLDRCQLAMGRLRPGRPDLQVHLEGVFSTYLGACDENWLIPNQEWANMHQLQYLPYLSRILCKTRAAVSAYSSFNPQTIYIGFSNRLAADPPPFDASAGRYGRFLHVAGNNRKKGTQAVVDAWRAHPQWPGLDLVVEDSSRFGPVPDNVTVWQSISDAELEGLRRTSGVVLAPSEAEGFGHVILDALSWGAVTVITDAEPMNELVGPDRGMLVPWIRKEPCRLGHRYYVAPEDVSAVVENILASSASQLGALAERGRAWAESNHREFESAFKKQLAATGKNVR